MESHRYLQAAIAQDALAEHKMAFVSGPRQVGKTTMARQMLRSAQNLYNWDDSVFRRAWNRSPVDAISMRGPGPIALDELHKDKRWKTRLKGLFDLRGMEVPIIVTGSARLDVYRRGGESLLGRYIPYRLHPFSVGESPTPPSPPPMRGAEWLDRGSVHYRWTDLVRLGGFPEPLFRGSEAHAKRWSRLRLDRLVESR